MRTAACTPRHTAHLSRLVLSVMLLAGVLGIAAAESPVAVNRTLPRVTPPRSGVTFPPDPTPADFLRARLFGEPLVPIGGVPSRLENATLASAVVRYSRRTDPDDFAALTGFREQFPESPWSAALLLGLGLEYYHTGHYSLALDAWEKAWPLAREATDTHGKAIGDRAAGELAFMYARLGRMTELEALLKSVDGRVFVGPATEKISGARAGLSNMKERPEIAFRCGPLALHRIMVSLDPTNTGDEIVFASASTQQGLSLSQVADLSRKLGLNYRMAFRGRDSSFVVPAVVHWKVGHYAALIRQEGERFLVQDPTFLNDVWITRKALEEETSGFFLVPPGELDAGWRVVEVVEAATIWGKGNTGGNDNKPHGPGDDKVPKDCKRPNGMAVASVHLMVVNLNLHDEPVGYQPPIGPAVRFDVRYNHREAFQPTIFTYSNLGPKWTCDWISYITDNPLSPAADVQYYIMGGGTRAFTGFNTANQSFAYQQFDQTRLTRTVPGRYEMVSSDGSKQVFSQPDGSAGSARKVFLTDIIDPAGNAIHLTYDAELRLVAITDAIGQVTTIAYSHPLDALKITRVTDPFGRFATFDYDGVGRLKKITDVIGLASEFAYEGTGDFINALTTPYGVTAFSRGESGTTRWLETLYPDGERERVEFNQSAATGVAASDPPESIPLGMATLNNYLQYRNTFYWSKIACATAYKDYSKARIYHWLHTPDFSTTAGILESIKEPLEGRIWYDYLGQSFSITVGSNNQPAHIGRVLDDGSTQLRTFEYNGYGHITKSVDPVGRTFSYTYSPDGIDLLKARQTRAGNNELLSWSTYNDRHQPLTKTDAAGQTTVLTYDARGQILTQTNPRGDMTTYAYDANGSRTAADGPLSGNGDTAVWTHDALGRIRTRTDVGEYAITFDYDALDRPAQITFSDGTHQQLAYTRLNLTGIRSRSGGITSIAYDNVGQMTKRIDPLGRITHFQWCKCGDSKSLTDPMGRTTTWAHDLQGRVTEKKFTDGSKISYLYEESTGRLRMRTDAKSQITLYSYDRDDAISGIHYARSAVATSPVTFTYDKNYPRLASMTDGTGTTVYGYHAIRGHPSPGAGQLASVDGPLPDDTIIHTYDNLGRRASTAINGVRSSVIFDPAGRVTRVTNALGVFSLSYDGVSNRKSFQSHPNGQTAEFSYARGSHDQQLERITNKTGGTPISEFIYGRDGTTGQITNWSQRVGLNLPSVYSLAYDLSGQLIVANVTQGGQLTRTIGYMYDTASNRSTIEIDGATRRFSYTALNELTFAEGDSDIGTTYQWDAENRVSSVSSGNETTVFTYDGVGRRVRIRHLVGGEEKADRRFVWCDNEICEERTSEGIVSKRFFAQGVREETGSGSGNYGYTRDHLGSVRELVDDGGAIRARFEYDPFGSRRQVEGDLNSDLGFAGLFCNPVTRLSLATYRAYDPELGRWLSRDPLPDAEKRDGNLYIYAGNDPINMSDPNGLQKVQPPPVPAPPGPQLPPGPRMCQLLPPLPLWSPPDIGGFGCLSLCMLSSNPHFSALDTVGSALLLKLSGCDCNVNPGLGGWMDVAEYEPCPTGPLTCEEPIYSPAGPNHSGP